MLICIFKGSLFLPGYLNCSDLLNIFLTVPGIVWIIKNCFSWSTGKDSQRCLSFEEISIIFLTSTLCILKNRVENLLWLFEMTYCKWLFTICMLHFTNCIQHNTVYMVCLLNGTIFKHLQKFNFSLITWVCLNLSSNFYFMMLMHYVMLYEHMYDCCSQANGVFDLDLKIGLQFVCSANI